jgi:lysozyme
MVSLPDPNQFLGSATKPVKAELSSAEVASPYAEMAKSLDKAGEGLNAYAIEEAKKAGAEAGMQARIDDNGNIIMDKSPFYMGAAAPEFRRAATMTAAAKMEPQIQNQMLQLRFQHPDPVEFQKAASEMVDGLGAKINDPVAKSGILHMAAQSAAGNYRTLLTETNTNQIKDTLATYKDLLTRNSDQAESVAFQGGYNRKNPLESSPQFIGLIKSQKQIFEEMGGDKRLGVSQAQIDILQKDAMDRINVQSVIGDIVRKYQTKGNVVAAKNEAEERFSGPDGDELKLSPKQRLAAVAETIKHLSLLDAADRETIRDNTVETTRHVNDILKNPNNWNIFDHNDRIAEATALKNWPAVHMLESLPILKDWNQYYLGLPPEERAIARGYFERGQFPPEFHPSSMPPIDRGALSNRPLGPETGTAPFAPGEFPQPKAKPREEIPGLTIPAENVPAVLSPRAATHGGLAPSFVEAIKRSEGLDLTAKFDFKQASYGYGTRAPYVGARTTKEQAERDLDVDLTKAAKVVDAVNPNLDPGTRAALTSLTFNAGSAWTTGTLGQRIRAGDVEGAKQPFLAYIHAGGAPLRALGDRRAQEVSWFGAAQAPPGPPAAVAGGGAPLASRSAVYFQAIPRSAAHGIVLSGMEAVDKKTANALFDDLMDRQKDGNCRSLAKSRRLSRLRIMRADPEKIDKLVTAASKRQAPLVRARQGAQSRISTPARPLACLRANTNLQSTLSRSEEDTRSAGRSARSCLLTLWHARSDPRRRRDPLAIVGNIQKRQKTAAQVQEIEKDPSPISLIGKNDNVGPELTAGDGAHAAQFMTALQTIRDDGNFFATLAQPQMKQAIVGLSYSNDPVKMAAGMNAIISAWERNKPMAEQIFESNIDRMQKYKGLQDILPANLLAATLNTTKDKKTLETLEAAAKKEITGLYGTAIKPEDIAYQIGSGFPGIGRLTGATPAVPHPELGEISNAHDTATQLMVDWEKVIPHTGRQISLPRGEGRPIE